MLDSDLVRLLLRDFEGNTADCLWETDEQGCLRNVSARLVQLLGLPFDLEDVDLPLALASTRPAGLDAQDRSWVDLARCFEDGKPFLDLPVKVWVGGEMRWWALTAQPTQNLASSSEGWLGVARDVTAQKNHHDEIEQQANFDSLTGLPSRFAFQRAVQPMLSRDHHCMPLVTAHIDVNGFKAINAAFGYPAGDLVLQEVAKRLLACAGPDTLLARLGGDDFILCLERPEAEALSITQKVVDSLQKPMLINHKPVELQVSAGVTFCPRHCADMGEMFQTSGMALAAAKEQGAGAVCVYEAEYGELFLRRMRTIQEIKVALEQEQFELWYQPQIDVKTLTTVGAEALVRWRHPQRGLVSPLEFIPLAEQSGQIVALGTWVLYRACHEASKWPGVWKVSVNVAPAQLQAKNFLVHVEQALRGSGLAPARLKLEITESALVDGNARIRSILQDLRTMGVCVSLDDFGTGYSSLSYLRQFPFTELKIDQSFVRAMLENNESLAIVETILQLARALNLATTAEGVETVEQAGLLKEIGCDRYQGYLYGKPMPHAQFLQEFTSTVGALELA